MGKRRERFLEYMIERGYVRLGDIPSDRLMEMIEDYSMGKYLTGVKDCLGKYNLRVKQK